MLHIAFAAISAMVFQAEAPGSSTASPTSQLAEIERSFEIRGACERALPPEMTSRLREQLVEYEDIYTANALMIAAYDRGKGSSEREPATPERCQADLQKQLDKIGSLRASVRVDAPQP
ncbi:hypothetical protein [Brevundimonas sp.]|uniref:hypothetical protein n=1 Tax=Brevundimonas sp. TaxID=1871086 RepID=UPI003D6D704F